MCKKIDESMDHVVSGCSKFAQKQYKRGHDNLGKMYFGNLLESVILKLEINGKDMNQKVF